MNPSLLMIAALVIFAATYIFIITEWINKMLAALIGGFLVVLTGIVNQEVVFEAIDWNVIFFLIGMMLVISVLRKTGIFMFVAIKSAKLARGNPLTIMMMMFMVTAFSSAFLGSVTSIMILIPIVMLISHELKIGPIPFIVTMVIASNMGGAATMVGDPPNILIGSATNYNFIDFILNLTPPVIIITLISLLLIFVMYRKKIRATLRDRAKLMSYKEKNLVKDKRLLIITLTTVLVMLVTLAMDSVLHIGTATIAMSAGLFLLIISSRQQVEQVLVSDVDWVTIFFFIGLFMIVESLVKTGFIDGLANQVMTSTRGEARPTAMAILWLSGVFSAFVDNVPFVATLIPMVQKIGTVITQKSLIDPIWWSLSLGACLGGNGTLIGASANVVAVGIARHNGVRISFWEFVKISASFTLLSLVVSSIYILVRYF
ncbi:MAG: ArsB/NhaD family transporter [Candidatus Syntrophosphaera sp.]